jgi:primosomal protein N' (replication factor Y) (superfamily II helicase)
VNLEYVTKGGERAAERETTAVAERLRARILRLGLADVDVIGPAPAFFAHERGRARWHVVVRAGDPYPLLVGVSLGPGWRVDVDPVSLL